MKEIEETRTLKPQFEKRGGLLPVIVQDAQTGKVLMLGYANQEAFEKTVETQKATFFSTSRNALWTKGETSGDYINVSSIWVDCDQDALIYEGQLLGEGACHTKNKEGKARSSCFYRVYDFTSPDLTKTEE